MSEEITVEYTPLRGPRRRVRFAPRSDGGYWRITEEHTGCRWRVTGREPVTDFVAAGVEVIG